MNPKVSVYKNSSKKEYVLTQDQRDNYRKISQDAHLAKLAAIQGLHDQVHEVNTPKINPKLLMPQLDKNGLTTLSLFSGGGGLDLGFDRAGFNHTASFELIPICGETLKSNRPDWNIYSGPEKGDVTNIDWKPYKGKIDVIQGGPPCQPFSIAGQQKGYEDERNMWGEFNRAVNTIQPRAFVAENVLGLLNPKFEDFVEKYIIKALNNYHIIKFVMNATDYGVPQIRKRVFFIGFKYKKDLKKFSLPQPTHYWTPHPNSPKKTTNALPIADDTRMHTMGVREALGLPDIGYDNLAPTIRSAFTGKRNTTSILNSSAGQKSWADIEVWPNGVQSSREKASAFPAKNDHFRLSIQDCSLLQGFTDDWKFSGAVYQVLGQIGNSVAPPVAYAVAKNLALALKD